MELFDFQRFQIGLVFLADAIGLNGLPEIIENTILRNFHASGKIKEAFSIKVRLSTTESVYTR